MPRIGDYEVLSELGRGGMGVVYRARHVGLGREVALKVVTGAGAALDPLAVQRFVREAESAARLHHPGIVAVHAAGWLEGRPYMALELVDGESLAERVRRTGPLPQGEAALLVAAVADAVAHAHARGVLHRDLKPANVLVGADGRPRLTDFGIARAVEEGEAERLTKTGAMLGTPSYAAPELLGGDRGEVGPGVDVYGLGALLYDLLAGRPPHLGTTMLETVHAVLARPEERLERLRPDVAPGLAAICHRCLAKRPDDRFPSAAAVADALRAHLGGVADATGAGRAWGRRGTAVAGAGLAVVAVAAAAAGLVLGRGPSSSEPATAPPPVGSGTPARAPSGATSPAVPRAAPEEAPERAPVADPTAWVWTNRTPPPGADAPEPRCLHAATYDPVGRRVLVHGGRTGGQMGKELDDLWAWDGARWTRLERPGPKPPGRLAHQVVWDEARSCLVLFGGKVFEYDVAVDDLWEWTDVDGWRRPLGQDARRPKPRSGHAMAYDRRARRVVVHGGVDLGKDPDRPDRAASSFDDTWTWDGKAWRRLDAQGGRPPARERGVLVDGGEDLLLYAGSVPGEPRELGDAWALRGATWVEVRRSGEGPPGGMFPLLAPIGGRLVELDPWRRSVWVGDGAAWSRVEPPRPLPSKRLACTWTWFPDRGALLLIGGSTTADTFSPVSEVWAFGPP